MPWALKNKTKTTTITRMALSRAYTAAITTDPAIVAVKQTPGRTYPVSWGGLARLPITVTRPLA